MYNIIDQESNTYDAIVVGSGISGGYAAKELCEKGLKVLLLERGKDIKHIEGYKNALTDPWNLPHRGHLTNEQKAKFPYQSIEGNYPIDESNCEFWLPFEEIPYERKQDFNWFRGNGIGGKSLTWGRQVYRWSDLDFEANDKEGRGIDWPIRYKDIESWYTHVEKFVGVSGEALGLSHLPDSVFQKAMELNCVEKEVKLRLKKTFPDRPFTIGRTAHITEPTKEQQKLGRASCQYRNACSKGCPYGAYFSTQSASLPAAMATGNLTVRPFSVAKEIIFDNEGKMAKGVRIVDKETKEEIDFYAKIVFLNASSMATTQIMLNSTSQAHPNGLGNEGDQLGRNIMDHHSRVGAKGDWEGNEDDYYFGRRANGIFIPRYRNLGNDKRDYLGGFNYQGGAGRSGWQKNVKEFSFGSEFKNELTLPGSWTMGLVAFGETLPYDDNTLTLSKDKKDQFGIPLAVFDASIKENEHKMRKEMASDAAEMLESVGVKNVNSFIMPNFPLGLSKHEMGGARMGKDPKSSVLNSHNQVWGCENVFVTDGACMSSSGSVNPSLTYLALTARAVDFAVSELNKKNL
ncbi:Choline dehydrogenase [Spirosomataceae bacterium TFI 002]|nr:Choline dehydrogenase [Spirosomataceae bacterium TFI 002]